MPIGNLSLLSNPEGCPNEVQAGDQGSAGLRASGVSTPSANRLSFLLFSSAERDPMLTVLCLLCEKKSPFLSPFKKFFLKVLYKTRKIQLCLLLRFVAGKVCCTDSWGLPLCKGDPGCTRLA